METLLLCAKGVKLFCNDCILQESDLWIRHLVMHKSLQYIRFITDEQSDTSSESQSDSENLSQENQSYRPYRDSTAGTQEPRSYEDDRGIQEEAGPNTMEPALIRKKVKQSLAKKQQKARRTKRGEAGVVTRKRRENRSAIKQSSEGIW